MSTSAWLYSRQLKYGTLAVRSRNLRNYLTESFIGGMHQGDYGAFLLIHIAASY